MTTNTNNTRFPFPTQFPFPRLAQAVADQAIANAESTAAFIRDGYMPHWAEHERVQSDNGLRQYSTARRWEQYQAGEITREKALELAAKRAAAQISKSAVKKIERLQLAASAPVLSSVSVSVHWTRNRTWGNNPTAEVYADGYTNGHASGCGYDKESAAIAEAFNASPAMLRVLYELAENALTGGYDPRTGATCTGYTWRESIGYASGYDVLPYYEGGCGSSCFWAILEKAGFRVNHAGWGKRFDVWTLDREAQPAQIPAAESISA